MAAPATLTFDPAQTQIRFEVAATLHHVEGSARLAAGVVHFDTEGGPASGRIEIDARSLETGNELRDGAMHADVLESERFPQIVFLPELVEVKHVGTERASLRLIGRIRIHGTEHPLTIPAELRADGDQIAVEARFPFPYVRFGLSNPGNFLLSLDDVVNVQIDATCRIDPGLP